MVGQIDGAHPGGQQLRETSLGVVAQVGGAPLLDHAREADAFARQTRALVERGVNQFADVFVGVGAVDAVRAAARPEEDFHRRAGQRRPQVGAMLVEVDDPVAAPVLLDQGAHVVHGGRPRDEDALGGGREREALQVGLERLELEDVGVRDAGEIPLAGVVVAQRFHGVDGRLRAAQPDLVADGVATDLPRRLVEDLVLGDVGAFVTVLIAEPGEATSAEDAFDRPELQRQPGACRGAASETPVRRVPPRPHGVEHEFHRAAVETVAAQVDHVAITGAAPRPLDAPVEQRDAERVSQRGRHRTLRRSQERAGRRSDGAEADPAVALRDEVDLRASEVKSLGRGHGVVSPLVMQVPMMVQKRRIPGSRGRRFGVLGQIYHIHEHRCKRY